ncbi:MAG: ComF family protein [bacterium]|nr:ComF family protein [bacterium]
MYHQLALTLKSLFIPAFCRTCGRRLLTDENGHFCPTCWELSPRIERPFCLVCGRPHPVVVGTRDERLFPCAECSKTDSTPPYRSIRGAAYFDASIAAAIKLFKFNGKARLARPLGELMIEQARRELSCDTYDYVIPVPLHRVRERARGFNQALLLANEILPAFPNAQLSRGLERVRPTRVQSLLVSEDERRENVNGAFVVKDDASLQGSTVLLVDDVVTTAGTVIECCAALRGAGAVTVDVLVAALAAPVPGHHAA